MPEQEKAIMMDIVGLALVDLQCRPEYILPMQSMYVVAMSNTRKKNTLPKRDQALNDATHGQFGEEPRPGPKPDPADTSSAGNHRKDRVRSARKASRSL